MTAVNLLILESEAEYREEYARVFLDSPFFLSSEIQVVFSREDFDHIFFEPSGRFGPSGEKLRSFSFRRARRMLFMDAILSGNLNIEMLFECDTGNLAVFCDDLECVMYLRNRMGSNCLQVGTFFDFGKDHAKMCNKQKKKCEPITLREVKQRYGITPKGEKAVILGPTTF